jgi:hypothetical protein
MTRFKKNQPVWVARNAFNEVFDRYEFDHLAPGGEFAILYTGRAFPWAYMHFPVEAVLDHDPSGESE